MNFRTRSFSGLFRAYNETSGEALACTATSKLVPSGSNGIQGCSKRLVLEESTASNEVCACYYATNYALCSISNFVSRHYLPSPGPANNPYVAQRSVNHNGALCVEKGKLSLHSAFLCRRPEGSSCFSRSHHCFTILNGIEACIYLPLAAIARVFELNDHSIKNDKLSLQLHFNLK